MSTHPVKGKLIPLEEDNAIAEAIRQINPDVVAAHPITPQTEIVMTFSEYVSQGRSANMSVRVESTRNLFLWRASMLP